MTFFVKLFQLSAIGSKYYSGNILCFIFRNLKSQKNGGERNNCNKLLSQKGVPKVGYFMML
jgi:hypothetical protein